jgi:hypothetical protein
MYHTPFGATALYEHKHTILFDALLNSHRAQPNVSSIGYLPKGPTVSQLHRASRQPPLLLLRRVTELYLRIRSASYMNLYVHHTPAFRIFM